MLSVAANSFRDVNGTTEPIAFTAQYMRRTYYLNKYERLGIQSRPLLVILGLHVCVHVPPDKDIFAVNEVPHFLKDALWLEAH